MTILTRNNADLKTDEIIDGIQVFRPLGLGSKITAAAMFSFSCIPILHKLRPDLIHAHEVFSPTTTAIMAKAIFHVPIITMAHRSGPLGDVQVLLHGKFGNQRMKFIRRYVDKFISISKEMDSEFASVGVPLERRGLIPNGVNTEIYKPLLSEEKKQKRKELGIPIDIPIVIYTGRLAAEKCVSHLLDAWSVIMDRYPDAQLLILGSGPEENLLKGKHIKNVEFLGHQSSVLPYLQASDIFVLPSSAEGLSVAMLEALSCGLAVVVTDVGGAPDIIQPGVNGFLVPVGAPDALVDKITSLLEDKELRIRVGEAGRKTVIENYSLEKMADKFVSLYHHLVINSGKNRRKTND